MQIKTQEQEIYELFNNTKKKYGEFNKCLFHLHTPASYDYCLYEKDRQKAENDKNNYNNLSDLDLYNIALKEGLFTEVLKLEDIKYSSNIFYNIKEYITYLLIAHKIITNEIKTVVISDHNTITGYKKLLEAVKDYAKNKVTKVYPEVILGIEISCADLNHVVSIFDKEQYNVLDTFIKEYIMDEKKKREYIICSHAFINTIDFSKDERIKIDFIADKNILIERFKQRENITENTFDNNIELYYKSYEKVLKDSVSYTLNTTDKNIIEKIDNLI